MILQAISGTCFHLSKISGICFHLSEITISLRFWKLDLGNISLRFLKTCFHLSKISETCFHLSLRLYFSKILNTPNFVPWACWFSIYYCGHATTNVKRTLLQLHFNLLAVAEPIFFYVVLVSVERCGKTYNTSAAKGQ